MNYYLIIIPRTKGVIAQTEAYLDSCHRNSLFSTELLVAVPCTVQQRYGMRPTRLTLGFQVSPALLSAPSTNPADVLSASGSEQGSLK